MALNYDEKFGLLNEPGAVEKFEDFVSVGTTRDQLNKIFLVSENYVWDEWCRKVYGLDFGTVWGLFAQRAVAEYKKCLLNIAEETGNATAINTMNQVILNFQNQSDVKISVVSNVPKETDDGGTED